MAISVICPNGHDLKIKDKYAGRKGLCPKCNAVVNVPELAMSEQAVVELLGPSRRRDSDSLPVHQDNKHRTDPGDDDSTVSGVSSVLLPKSKICPKCKHQIAATFHVCPHCRTYFDEGTAGIGRVTRPDCPVCLTACLPGDVTCAACGTDLRMMR